MTDFLWHKVSEKEKKEIEKQVKSIMDGFSKKLSKVDKKIKEPLIERDESEREEEKIKNCEIDRKIMFDNAPDTLGKGTSKNADFIIAEKKSW